VLGAAPSVATAGSAARREGVTRGHKTTTPRDHRGLLGCAGLQLDFPDQGNRGVAPTALARGSGSSASSMRWTAHASSALRRARVRSPGNDALEELFAASAHARCGLR
jgi:hypothetical protein